SHPLARAGSSGPLIARSSLGRQRSAIVRKMARAMILAAGLGTRLLPLSHELPKPLMPLGDRPVLAQVVAALERAGVEAGVVNAHHLPEFLFGFAESCPFLLKV